MSRPRKYNNCLDLDAACELYFEDCEEKQRHPTISGLALALGFKNRRSITDYKDNKEFSHTIKKARLYVESYLENQLYSGSVAGVIFNLKNNFGWKDKTEVDTKTDGELTIKWQE